MEYEVFFEEPGDYYEFTVDAVNEGTLDGIIESITSTVNGEAITTLPNYINYSIKYADGTEVQVEDELKKNESKTYKIRVEYDKEKITPEVLNAMTSDQRYEFSFEVKYVQKVKTPSSIPAPVAFATDSWETIASVGALSDPTTGPYQVGDTKTIEMDVDGDGTSETYNLRIANLSKPAVCSSEGFSQTACGLVLEFTGKIASRKVSDSGKGGWKASDLRAFLNSGKYLEGEANEVDYTGIGFIDKLPADLKAVIADTKVVSGHSSRDTENFTTTDKIYLFASKEVWGDTAYSVASEVDSAEAETRQLDYYASQGVTTENYSGAVKENSIAWFLRSMNKYDSDNFFGVSGNGKYFFGAAQYSQDISPAFRIG